MERTIICDKNEILLEKSYTEEEDEVFTVSFSCNYDNTSNLFKIMKKGKFYELLCRLNSDLVNEYSYEKNEQNIRRLILYFNEKYDGKDMVFSYDDEIIEQGEYDILINGKENNLTTFREGYSKFALASIVIRCKLIETVAHFNLEAVISSDDLVNDIIAMMLKKQVYRLKQYMEI